MLVSDHLYEGKVSNRTESPPATISALTDFAEIWMMSSLEGTIDRNVT